MNVDVLFAGVAVTEFEQARAWYERFFGRDPDIVANDEEGMWQLAGTGWLYIVGDPQHAGNSIVAMAVSNIETATSGLEARGVTTGPIEKEGEAGLKALVRDPDGNSIAIIEVAGRRG